MAAPGLGGFDKLSLSGGERGEGFSAHVLAPKAAQAELVEARPRPGR